MTLFLFVSRKYSDSSKSLTVDLACGHVEDSKSSLVDEEPDVRHTQVILKRGVDKISVNVPPVFSAFDLRSNNKPGNYMRCEITQILVDGILIDAGDEDFADFVEVSADFVEVSEDSDVENTFTDVVEQVMYVYNIPSFKTSGMRISLIKDAVLYTYLWGHYAGFIEMPRSSIRDLISYPTYVTDEEDDLLLILQKNESDLQRYRLLSSLFSSPGDDRHDVENFGLLNPEEAQNEYGYYYYDRYSHYHGTALGNFLLQVPEVYQ